MYKVLQYESVKNLIADGGYGCYRLYTLTGNELLCGSHLTSDKENQKMSPQDLIGHLETKVEYLGVGEYRIALKNSNSTQNSNEVNYRFRVSSDNGNAAVQPQAAMQPGIQGLGSDAIEKLINERVTQALAVEREKQLRDQQIKELENQLKELKSARYKKKEPHSWVKHLTGLGMMGAAVLIQEKFPNSVPLVEKVIAQINLGGEEEEEEEEETTGFSKPNDNE